MVMRIFLLVALPMALFAVVGSGQAEEIVFQDDFKGKLDAGWSWLREDRKGWRVTERGLEVRIQPGNMWGPGNDAKNVLVRPAPDRAKGELEVSVSVTNQPTTQYEQVDLVWYYDDRHMVKLGQELVDGQLSIVMGREEADQTRTIAIIPLKSFTVQLRLRLSGNRIRGQFRAPDSADWREAGDCDLPANGVAKVSLQCYQGPADAAHWARITDFCIRRHQK
jgi:regulation of enolase protein 1 (concanavalin A-like superfamily)